MMEGTSYMFLTGPKVVKTVTGEDVTQENLGGASVHSSKSGVTHFTSPTEEDALKLIRKLLSYIPQNNLEEPPLHRLHGPHRPPGGFTERNHPRQSQQTV